MSVRKKITVALVCLAVAFPLLAVRYVHRGYVGVIGSGQHLRLVGRGPHLKAPWDPLIYYPIRSHHMHLRTVEEGIEGKVEFDIVLSMSVSPDSVIPLHRTYHGAYMERLVSPLIVEFLRQRGQGSESWYGSSDCEKEGKAILQHLNSTLPDHGINVHRAWLRSFEVATDTEEYPASEAD